MIDPNTAREILDIAIPVLMAGSGIIGAGCTELYHSLSERGSSDHTATPHDGEDEDEYGELLPEASYPDFPQGGRA